MGALDTGDLRRGGAAPPGGRPRPARLGHLVGAARLGVVFAVPWLALPTLYVGERLGGSAGWWIASYGLVGVGAAVLLSADYQRGRGRTPEEARAAVLAALPVAACVVVLAVGILLAEDVRWERFVPVAALVGGAALFAASRREFVAPAMLALGAAVVIVASGARLEGGLGDLKVTASDAEDGRIVARRAVGDVEVDLRGLRGRSVSVAASAGIGDVQLTVPRAAWLELDSRVGQGTIDGWSLDEAELQGFDQRLVEERAGRRGRGRVQVVAEAGVGAIEIVRIPGP